MFLTACTASLSTPTPAQEPFAEPQVSPSPTVERLMPPTATFTSLPTPTLTIPVSPTQVLPTEASSPTPAILDENLGLSAGVPRLVAALQPREEEKQIVFERTTSSDGSPIWVGHSPDGQLRFEIIGPEENPITASLAALLPEDKQAHDTAVQALYRLIEAAMPDRAWAHAWLDERLDKALAGVPFSATYQGYYVQIVRLNSPQPYVYLAVTLEPKTLALPSWGTSVSGQDLTTWDYLPIMPGGVNQQRVPTERLEMLEYLVARSLEEVEAFYASEMSRAHWERVERAVMGDPAHPEQYQIVMVYRRGVEGAIVLLEPLGVQQTLVTLGYAEDASDLPAIAG